MLQIARGINSAGHVALFAVEGVLMNSPVIRSQRMGVPTDRPWSRA